MKATAKFLAVPNASKTLTHSKALARLIFLALKRASAAWVKSRQTCVYRALEPRINIFSDQQLRSFGYTAKEIQNLRNSNM